MGTASAKADLGQRLKALSQSPEAMDPRQAMELVEAAVASLADETGSGQTTAGYTDLQELSEYIKAARSEIAELRPQEINEEHLPTAADELDAIVESTEKATNSIFEAVEAIEELTAKMTPETADAVSAHVTAVFEACSFQDITGQRITKVVSALKQVEEKIELLLAALGTEAAPEAEPGKRPARTSSSSSTPARPDEHLLNGPQREEDAISQEDIDALLNAT